MLPRVILAVLLIAAWRTDVYAVHNVTVCGETCSSGEQCNLMNDLSCATNPAVTLNGGANFDFKGKKLTCAGCAASAVAVQVNAGSSTIQDTIGGGGAFGAWNVGINCNYNASSIAKNVRVDGSYTGINGCRKVQAAVVKVVPGGTGISNLSIGSTDYVKDSYVLGGQNGIHIGGSGGGLIDHNVVSGTAGIQIFAYTTSSSLRVTNNMLFTNGALPIGTGATPPVTSGNVCGDPEIQNCANCIIAGNCIGPFTPFVGP